MLGIAVEEIDFLIYEFRNEEINRRSFKLVILRRRKKKRKIVILSDNVSTRKDVLSSNVDKKHILINKISNLFL